jgi:hypothetical protein
VPILFIQITNNNMFNPRIRIPRIDHVLWHGLKNKCITNEWIHINKCGDIWPFKNGPVIKSKNIFITDCDKNFVRYWLNTDTFPNAKNIFLDITPLEPRILSRFDGEEYGKKKTNIIIMHDVKKLLRCVASENLTTSNAKE